ncbi:MAG: pantoate--beta-alanine ligase, partial [Flavisolibacter sp.]|nr:pantoate--beta-alanine ligase [Flavisolibacter sp.]
MIVFKPARPLSMHLTKEINSGKKAGFVPTMGALHEGHISLIRASVQLNDLTICSIFINPTQFNNNDDFQNYPVTIAQDIEKLEAAGCDILFLPPVQEIYRDGFKAKHYELGLIEQKMEGEHRPGHFQGVCQVVDRLLDIVHASQLFLGQKDFQQCIVIRKLLELTGRNETLEMVMMPTIRENDGLAMSSRNVRLNEKERVLSTAIFHALSHIKQGFATISPEALKQAAKIYLESKGFAPDYVEILSAKTLETPGNNN